MNSASNVEGLGMYQNINVEHLESCPIGLVYLLLTDSSNVGLAAKVRLVAFKSQKKN